MSKFPCLLATALLASQAATVRANDSCLVGRWEPQGNAMADWVKKRNPQMALHYQPQQALLVFKVDGSYSAEATGQASARNGAVAASMQGHFGGNGRWRTEGRQLLLTPTQDRTRADMQVQGANGVRSRIKLPQGMLGGTQTWGYRCSGNTLETQLTPPGSKDVVVQPYLRK